MQNPSVTLSWGKVTSLTDPGEGLCVLIEWLHRRPAVSAVEDEPPHKKQRADDECKICFDGTID